ncbi:PhzF family phenazine biosynthesis protein [Polymorphum gilvum]|uniref:Phenazine biosynthesis protein PhzF family n=1 Tax=Polymorphum gilvum (strain LMG 25793 / CGMCC 1.9160 / SL003B-26A1) TaxID=991905 RepID=F2J2C2_POLGS|nr:PhzF family phenazine biosynthesis protein [Polymorphum gilvum]ADZ69818.1 Phenazine biosynthesis protein PhzF family [Polymorphum gilvum SL003B-26A1]
MGRRYAVLDVFTSQPLAGNPLAVVLDAEGLDDGRMQAIAREFNLSETVFVLPAENPAHSACVRIFTPAAELPFAGHPTVGTAVLLATERFGQVDGEQDAMVVLEEIIGAVRCGVVLRENAAGFAEFDVPRLPRSIEPVADSDAIAAALGLEPSEIGFENHVPTSWEVGVPFHYVPVRDLEVIARAAPVPALWARAFGQGSHRHAYVYCRETRARDSAFHARMFAPDMGLVEDPATGAAAASFAGPVHRFDALPNGTHFLRLEQGFEMGRPSLIDLGIDVEGGALHAVRIGGQATVVARGELFV